MADDPAFLFYPGDYLRDTQCLSESVQVAYDRIICEHMRNICITQQQLNFFTKRLNPDQKSELMQVLTKVTGGFQIKWVADSIQKRREYSESRRKNREGKQKKQSPKSENISKTYVPHMENAIENEIVIERNTVKSKSEIFEKLFQDEKFISDLSLTHRGKDLKQAFEECYTHHSNAPNPPSEVWQWKQKLNTWLTISPNKKNGTSKDKRSEHLTGLAKDFAERHGTGSKA